MPRHRNVAAGARVGGQIVERAAGAKSPGGDGAPAFGAPRVHCVKMAEDTLLAVGAAVRFKVFGIEGGGGYTAPQEHLDRPVVGVQGAVQRTAAGHGRFAAFGRRAGQRAAGPGHQLPQAGHIQPRRQCHRGVAARPVADEQNHWQRTFRLFGPVNVKREGVSALRRLEPQLYRFPAAQAGVGLPVLQRTAYRGAVCGRNAEHLLCEQAAEGLSAFGREFPRGVQQRRQISFGHGVSSVIRYFLRRHGPLSKRRSFPRPPPSFPWSAG